MGTITKLERPGVRCPTCGAKLAEELNGVAVILCRKCRDVVTIRRNDAIATSREDDAA